ncbi:MAG: hypothetical protein PHH11_18795, partial [Methylomonas sp.]|nr:hypothetical protein [Methylomonas sp.]
MNTISENIAFAKAAIDHVNMKMDIGASNKNWPISEWWGKGAKFACAGSVFNEGEMRVQVRKALQRVKQVSGQFTNEDVLNSQAEWASLFGCGNCGEQSSIAFVFLRNKGVRSLDWMDFIDRDHAFVIINRQAGSDQKDYKSWGADAVLCD